MLFLFDNTYVARDEFAFGEIKKNVYVNKESRLIIKHRIVRVNVLVFNSRLRAKGKVSGSGRPIDNNQQLF